MKILLLGEFSGLHTNLKAGLEHFGHSVELLSTGDGFKNIKGDINITSKVKNRYLRAAIVRLKSIYYLPIIRNYDIVQYIYPRLLPLSHKLSLLYLKYLKRNNGRVFLNVSGGDAYLITYLISALKYTPYLNEWNEGIYDKSYKLMGYSNLKEAIEIAKSFTGIIASSYTYSLPYKNFTNYYGFIPMPMEIPETMRQNVVGEKIKIFHGITRKAMKGSNYILKALDLIKEKYSEKVDIQVVEGVSLEEYKKLFDDCNIFIDQACSYGYGMNALLALAKGKVVLGGCELGTNELVNMECPVINILPDKNDIFNKLENLICNEVEIGIKGEKSYQFVKKYHDHINVAQKYIEAWSK